MLRLLLIGAAALALAADGGSSDASPGRPSRGTPSGGGSGIRGSAVLTVLAEESQREQSRPTSTPLAGAVVAVRPAAGGREIARQRADRAGRFLFRLPPGEYVVVPISSNPDRALPPGTSRRVVVRAGRFEEVVLHFDTGVR
jgi:hypothetical protein